MTLGSLDANGIGRYAETTPVGATFSAYMNEGLAAVSTAATKWLADRGTKFYRWQYSTDITAQTGMVTGDLGYCEDDKTIYRYAAGAGWLRWYSRWLNGSPTPTGLTLGTGGVWNYYKTAYNGNYILLEACCTLGTSPTVGDVVLEFPYGEAGGDGGTPAASFADLSLVGDLIIADASPANRYRGAVYKTSSGLRLLTVGTSGLLAALNSSPPITFATGDKLIISARIPSAFGSTG